MMSRPKLIGLRPKVSVEFLSLTSNVLRLNSNSFTTVNTASSNIRIFGLCSTTQQGLLQSLILNLRGG